MRAPSLRTVTLRDRFVALTPRERSFLIVGGVCLLLFLLYLLFWRGETNEGPVELAASPPVLPTSPPPVAPISAPMLPVVTAAPVQAAGVASMSLQGVSGGGPGGGAALIQFQDGRQRLVRVGREIAPGTVLKSIGLTWAIAGTGGGDIRFDLNRPGSTPVAPGAVSSIAPVPAVAGTQAERRETTDLRLGLQPVSPGGRAGGYLVKAGPHMARLARAGLQPGDIIVGVNGSTLDQERLLELSWQMTNANRTEFEVVRAGKSLKLTLSPEQLR